jgi:hypothetical protein
MDGSAVSSNLSGCLGANDDTMLGDTGDCFEAQRRSVSG